MGKRLFITGTTTDIGKTYISGLIIKKLKEVSNNIGYFKAAMSGNNIDEFNNIIPGDALFVKNFANISQDINEMCPYVYKSAYSPHLSSIIEGNNIDINVVNNKLNELTEKYDYLTIEGSGGICCPLRHDDIKINLSDFVKDNNLSSIIVADAGLGTINYVVLTSYYMKNMGMKIAGIILNNYDSNNILHNDNLKMCEELTGIKVISTVKKNDIDLNIKIEDLIKLYE